LGCFEIQGENSILQANEWHRKKAADLLKWLAVEKRLLKDQVIEFLWPETDLSSGTNNLYKTNHDLRQIINSAFGNGSANKIYKYEDGVFILSSDVWVDVHEFEGICNKYPSQPEAKRAALIEAALSLYRGELLPDDIYAEWTIPHRNELSRLHREARLALAQTHLGTQNYEEVINLLKPLLKIDPADEWVHREMMRAFALSGRRHDSLRQYQVCVDSLASELDAPPGPETTVLYEQILNNNLIAPKFDPASFPNWSPPIPVGKNDKQSIGLAGRQEELEELSTIFKKARHGGRTILISGESGIGKTRLAVEALQLATQNGMQTLLGAAYEQEGRMPFQPYIEAFEHFLSEQGRNQIENPIYHYQSQGSSDPQQEHWALFKATANFILDLAKESGLAFLVDDLHAADETSLQLFHYLARQTRSAPVVLIAAYRIDAPTNAQLYPMISSLYREGLSHTIRLESLNQKAVQQILEEILGGKVDELLCRTIFDITAGNPFYTEEFGRDLINQNIVKKQGSSWFLKSGEGLQLPENLSSFLHQKVSRMGSSVEETLSAASVIGREFRYDILQGLSDLSNGEILDALDTALAGHLVEETPGGYCFRHPLIRRTLYESLSRVRRAHLHKYTAQTIETSFASNPDGLAKQVDALAYHYDLSDRRDRALPFLIQSGEKAAEVYAFEVAIEYFERALLLMDDLSLSDPAMRWRLLESLGWWHGGILADTPRAVACFEQALDVGTNKEQDWSPSTRDRVRAHCGAAMAQITSGHIEAADRHLQMALSIMGNREDAPEYADLLYNLAQLHWHRDEYDQAMEVAQRSLAIAERLNKPDAIARAFEMLALACHSLGEWQEGIAYEQQRAELAGAGLDVTDAFDVHL
jgi:DNA-binding SARP family transcriptional activator/type II secretory pathway predicted ATPase ExeA